MRLESPESYAGALARLFRQAGVESEIEVSRAGLIVYASNRFDASRVARGIQRAVLERDRCARVDGPEMDDGEPEATRWWAEVSFDWRVF